MNQPYATPEPPRRKRRFSLRRLFKSVLLIVCCLAIAFLAYRYGPTLYRRIFGSGNTTWISERFSEELKEKNELVVYEASITGQESVRQDAWLLGKVQEVVVPYTFHISFTVDLSHAVVGVENHDISVRLPAPVAAYHRLDVDKDNVTKYDWLYPLTTERYASIVDAIEQKLYDECSVNPDYLDAAWTTAVKNMQSLFQTVAAKSEMGETCKIIVTLDDTLGQPEPPVIADESPAATPTPLPSAA